MRFASILAASLLPLAAAAQTDEWVRDTMTDESLWLLRSNNLSTEAVGDQRWVMSKGDGPAYVVYFLPGRISEVEVDTQRAAGSAGDFSLAVSTDGKLFQPLTAGAVQLDSAFGWDYRLMASDQIPANATHLLVRFPDGSTAHRLSEVWIKFAWDDALASSFLPAQAQSSSGHGEYAGESDEELEALLAALSQTAGVGFAQPVSQSGYALPAESVFKVTEPTTPSIAASVEVPVLEAAANETEPEVVEAKEGEEAMNPESPIPEEEAATEPSNELAIASAESPEEPTEEAAASSEESTAVAETGDVPEVESSTVGESAIIANETDTAVDAETEGAAVAESADEVVEVATVENISAESSATPGPTPPIEAPAEVEQSIAPAEPVELVHATVEPGVAASEAFLDTSVESRDEVLETDPVIAPPEVAEVQEADQPHESSRLEGSSNSTIADPSEESLDAIALNLGESAIPEDEPIESAPLIEIDLKVAPAEELMVETEKTVIPEGVMESAEIPQIEGTVEAPRSNDPIPILEVAVEMSGSVLDISEEIELPAEGASGTGSQNPPLDANNESVPTNFTDALHGESTQITVARHEAVNEMSREFTAPGDVPTEPDVFVEESQPPEDAGTAIREDAKIPEVVNAGLEIEQTTEPVVSADVITGDTAVLELAPQPAAIEVPTEAKSSIQEVELISNTHPEEAAGIAQNSMATVVEAAEAVPIQIAIGASQSDAVNEITVPFAPDILQEPPSSEARLQELPAEVMATLAESDGEGKETISLESEVAPVAMHSDFDASAVQEPPALSSENEDAVASSPIAVEPVSLVQSPQMERQEAEQSNETLTTLPPTETINESPPPSEAIVAPASSFDALPVFTFEPQSMDAQSAEVGISGNDPHTLEVTETANQEMQDQSAGISTEADVDSSDSPAVVSATNETAELVAAEIEAPRKIVPRRKRIGPRSK